MFGGFARKSTPPPQPDNQSDSGRSGGAGAPKTRGGGGGGGRGVRDTSAGLDSACDKHDQVLLLVSQASNAFASKEGLSFQRPPGLNTLLEKVRTRLDPKITALCLASWNPGEEETRGKKSVSRLQDAEKLLPLMVSFSKCYHDKMCDPDVYLVALTSLLPHIAVHHISHEEYIKRVCVSSAVAYDWPKLVSALSNEEGVMKAYLEAIEKSCPGESIAILEEHRRKFMLAMATSVIADVFEVQFSVAPPTDDTSKKFWLRILDCCNSIVREPLGSCIGRLRDDLQCVASVVKFAADPDLAFSDDEITRLIKGLDDKASPLWKLLSASPTGQALKKIMMTAQQQRTEDAGHEQDILHIVKNKQAIGEFKDADFYSGGEVHFPSHAPRS
jgi:hypothetical protein